MRGHCLGALLLLVSMSAMATEINSKGFQFHLQGEWAVSLNNPAITAEKEGDAAQRTFMVSVYAPKRPEEGFEMLAYLDSYLNRLDKQNPQLSLYQSMQDYQNPAGVPFRYIVYQDGRNGGTFVGTLFGSNQGIMMVTYEGGMAPEVAEQELQKILDTFAIQQ